MVGYLADLFNRCRIFGVVVCLGATASGATYFSTTYSSLFVCRALTGALFSIIFEVKYNR